MEEYIAVDSGAEYWDKEGIRTLDSFYFNAENRQQAVDFIFSRIINKDEIHLRGFFEIMGKWPIQDYIRTKDRDLGEYLRQELPFYKKIVDNYHKELVSGEFFLKSNEELRNKKILKGMIDRKRDVIIFAYERDSIDRLKLFAETEGYLFNTVTGKKTPIEELTDIQLARNDLSGESFYELDPYLGWKQELLDDSGILSPSRLTDREIKDMLKLDSRYNPDLEVYLKKLEEKVFLV